MIPNVVLNRKAKVHSKQTQREVIMQRKVSTPVQENKISNQNAHSLPDGCTSQRKVVRAYEK